MFDKTFAEKLLFEYDPYDKTFFPNLSTPDSYRKEAAKIVKKLSELPADSDCLKKDAIGIIKKIIQKKKEPIEDVDEICEMLSAELLGLTDEHICPICRSHSFSQRGSYEKCPICDWIDDYLQDEDPFLTCQSNPLNIYGARLLHVLHTNPATSQAIFRCRMNFELRYKIAIAGVDPDFTNRVIRSFLFDLIWGYCENVNKIDDVNELIKYIGENVLTILNEE